MSGSRGEANFVWKCSLCKRESSISEFNDEIALSQFAPLTGRRRADFDNTFNRGKAL